MTRCALQFMRTDMQPDTDRRTAAIAKLQSQPWGPPQRLAPLAYWDQLTALCAAFMATRPDLRDMSLDQWLIHHAASLSPYERGAGHAILALINATEWSGQCP
jgi:hypothetical protein